MHRFVFVLIIFLYTIMPAQDFIHISDNQFMEGDSEFHFFGFNAYYLLYETAYGKSYVADDVFDAANEMGAKVIRTWAFYEADGLLNSAVIRPSPFEYNENALRALDYVIFKAKEKNLRLILSILNNNPHYGGITQYLLWGQKYLNRVFIKNDFYTNDTLKSWYKSNMHYLLNRINTYTNIAYKDEPAIFSFELINEGSNPQNDASVIHGWYTEMAAYFKSIDKNHLLTTGEMGEDDDRSQYSDINLFYNSSDFLFNGYKGTSYSKNTNIPGIDYGSFHLYTDGWGMHPAAGINWIKEHMFIAETLNKPSLLSEFGSRNNKPEVYLKWLDEVSTINCRSAMVWQFLHPDVAGGDSYGFNLNDTALINVFKNFITEINAPLRPPEIPINAQLFQNYPNPFNPVTTIKYALDTDDEISIELFSSLGERIGILDEGFKKAGTYKLVLSFDSERYSSGAYFYMLKTSRGRLTKKLLLLK